MNADEINLYTESGNLLQDAQQIIDNSRQQAYRSVNIAILQRNWLIGKRISDEILKGEDRAEYGDQIILHLSKELNGIYGKGFNKNNLYDFVRFYKIFPTLSGKSELKNSFFMYTGFYMPKKMRFFGTLQATYRKKCIF